jgi:hypothetical protein
MCVMMPLKQIVVEVALPVDVDWCRAPDGLLVYCGGLLWSIGLIVLEVHPVEDYLTDAAPGSEPVIVVE